MQLGLSHSLSRYKLKFSADKVDTMVIQAVGLLDELDKEINTYAMRVKEWYGWHFPGESIMVVSIMVAEPLGYLRNVPSSYHIFNSGLLGSQLSFTIATTTFRKQKCKVLSTTTRSTPRLSLLVVTGQSSAKLTCLRF